MNVSIIIPAYNEELYLPTLLMSLRQAKLVLLDQYPNYQVEIIVVDNASKDNTRSVAMGYACQVAIEERRNVSSARNRGAQEANGEILIFIDADYRVGMNFLREIVNTFENNNDIVALGVKVNVEPGDLDPIQRSFANFALFLLRLIKKVSFGVFVFRKGYFHHLGGFNEEFFAYEDVELHDNIKNDLRRKVSKYVVITDTRVYSSGRGFHRGGMISTYLKMLLSRESRKDPDKCAYWYERN